MYKRQHVYDAHTGEDLLPKVREMVKEKGFLPQDAEQRDQSWLDTYGMVQTIMADFPEFLPNTYDPYYLYPDYKVSHLDPNFTRADEVMAGREKRVFTACAEVIKEGKLGDKFHAISDAHAEMMIKVAEAIAYNKNDRHILIVENNGAIANMQDDAMVEVCLLYTSRTVSSWTPEYYVLRETTEVRVYDLFYPISYTGQVFL